MLRLDYDENLLPASERTAITTAVSGMIDRFGQQPEKLNLITLETASLVQVVSTRSNAALEQCWFWRTLNRWRGITERTTLENDADLARLVYLTQQTLNELQVRQLFTQEALLVLDNQVGLLAADVSRVQDGLINLQDTIKGIYGDLLSFVRKAEERFGRMERRQDLHEWILLLKTSRPVWQGQYSFTEMPLAAKLICLANEFFHESRGKWTKNDWFFLEVCLQELGVDPKQPVQPSLLYLDDARDELLKTWVDGIIDADELNQWATPAGTPLADAYKRQQGFQGDDRYIIDRMAKLLARQGVTPDRKVLAWDTVVDDVQQHAGRALDQAVPAHTLLRDLIGNLFFLNAHAVAATRGSSATLEPVLAEPTLPEVQSIHGWPADKVQALQQQTAAALGKPVVFRDTLQSGGEGPEMVVIPAGCFVMGSPADEPERTDAEGPQHEVTFSQPFALGRYAVTFDDYDRFCIAAGKDKPNDQGWGRGKRPVINVNWHDAQAYCAWLSRETGRRYRLPSEAEWEYGRRAGTTTPFHFGRAIDPKQANYRGNYAYAGGAKGEYRQKTLPVGQFPPNALGLYDCHGNVSAWCQDLWHDAYRGAPQDGSAWVAGNPAADAARVLRGGSWTDIPRELRSASRLHSVATTRFSDRGFRLAQDLSL